MHGSFLAPSSIRLSTLCGHVMKVTQSPVLDAKMAQGTSMNVYYNCRTPAYHKNQQPKCRWMFEPAHGHTIPLDAIPTTPTLATSNLEV
eukprot:1200128-Amphidinium_carterae.1